MFNDERRKNVGFIFERIKKLYLTFETPDEFTIGEWVGILDGYSQTDILDALKSYRKNVPYDKAPSPASFKEYLPEKHKHSELPENTQAAKGDFAWERMNDDIAAGSCRNNLYVYRDAEKIVLYDWLAKEIPASVWAKMDYAGRVQQAIDKGLFNNFDEAMRQAAQARFGRNYEFLSANAMESLYSSANNAGTVCKSLASHWRT